MTGAGPDSPMSPRHAVPACSSRGWAWLELARVGNLPTLVSNALVGWALATAAAPDWHFGAAVAATALLYGAGMAFNDVCDAPVDQRERPQRPIPSGRITPRNALIAVGLAIAVALLLLGAASSAAAAAGGVLAACIVSYDLLHSRTSTTVVLLGACRGLVYIMVGAAAAPPGSWSLPMPAAALFAGGIAGYVIVLSLVARGEMAPGPLGRGARAASATALLAVPLALLAVRRPESAGWTVAAAALLIVGVGLGIRHLAADPPRRGPAVGLWIAAIALVDAFFLTLLDRPGLAGIAVACWLATMAAQRRLAAT